MVKSNLSHDVGGLHMKLGYGMDVAHQLIVLIKLVQTLRVGVVDTLQTLPHASMETVLGVSFHERFRFAIFYANVMIGFESEIRELFEKSVQIGVQEGLDE